MRRQLSQLFVTGALIASVSVGCGQDDQQETSEGKVYGGSRVPAGAWLSTVGLSRGGSLFCSGTAITPTVVITAAHCVSGVSASSLTVYTGEGKEGGYVRGQATAKKIARHPKYNGNKGNDIAYIVLSTPLDLPASAYVPVLTDKDEIAELNAVGAKAQIVGFGTRNGNGFGLKYEVTTSVVKSISSFMSYDAATEIAVGGGGKDSCQGDSGGPVYGQLKTGEWRVYGVTSRGGSCGTGGIYGLMHANICWAQEGAGESLGLKAGTCGEEVDGTDDNEVTVPTTPVVVVDNEEEAPATSGSWWDTLFGN